MRRHVIQFFSSSHLVSSNATVHRLPRVFIRQVHNEEGRRTDSTDSKEFGKSSIANVSKHWCRRFENEGITEPKQSIDHIVAHILGSTNITKLTGLDEKKFTEEQLEKLDLLCNCRLSRMPVQYIIGEWDFRDITLKLEPPIFIPRPETEVLVEYLLKKIKEFKGASCNVLEIGCGSGAICLSLLKSNENVNVTAIDINPHACELTMKNAQNLKLDDRLILSNAKLEENGRIKVLKEYSSKPNISDEKYDFIISNPPYIPTEKIFKLQPEITLYEDIRALDGGGDGLKIIKPIIKYASENLRKDGYLVLEVDSSHPSMIKAFIEENYHSGELKVESIHKDFCKYDRFVEIVKAK